MSSLQLFLCVAIVFFAVTAVLLFRRADATQTDYLIAIGSTLICLYCLGGMYSESSSSTQLVIQQGILYTLIGIEILYILFTAYTIAMKRNCLGVLFAICWIVMTLVVIVRTALGISPTFSRSADAPIVTMYWILLGLIGAIAQFAVSAILALIYHLFAWICRVTVRSYHGILG